MSTPRLEVSIQHRFGPAFALDVDVAFPSVRAAFFGPSGSGKSSILAAIAGLWTPARGRIVVDGTVFFDHAARVCIPPRARRVGYVPQDALLFPLHTVQQNLEFGRTTHSQLQVQDVAAALEIDHLLTRRPRLLSGGERQRVALGRAILANPRLLACDEPFSALDAPRRNRLIDVVVQWCEHLAIPAVFVSHDVNEVRALADSVAILDAGLAKSCALPNALPDAAVPLVHGSGTPA